MKTTNPQSTLLNAGLSGGTALPSAISGSHAEGVERTSPGQRPGKSPPATPIALKGRSQNCALSGRKDLLSISPGALPRAISGSHAEGVERTSPGQRPGKSPPATPIALKGRSQNCALSGRKDLLSISPGALPRAGTLHASGVLVQGFEGVSPLSPRHAFTMIEIAISLAIIGFALVAIIGILPLGMTAQRDNRHETIINQDASVLMDAVRNGERGLDDLTNYVIGITNYETDYSGRNAPPGNGRPVIWGYTPRLTTLNGGAAPQQYPLTNGYTIIGLLSTPKIILAPNGGYFSNHVVGVFRSLSGPASEKPPQRNSTMQEMALTYKVVADVAGYGTNFFDPISTNYSGLKTNDPNFTVRYNNHLLVGNFQNNLRDVRLTFLWPLLPNGKLGDGRQVYRTMVAGSIINEPTNNIIRSSPFWFFQPRTYF